MIDVVSLYLAGCGLTIAALLLIARAILARRAEREAITQTPLATRARDYTTATCPLCGKYDPARPFISYAIDCHRDDCADHK